MPAEALILARRTIAQPVAVSSNYGAIHGFGVGEYRHHDSCLWRTDADSGGLRAELQGAFAANEVNWRGAGGALDGFAGSDARQLRCCGVASGSFGAAFVAGAEPAFVFARQTVPRSGKRRFLLGHKFHPLCKIFAGSLDKSGVGRRAWQRGLLLLALAKKPVGLKRSKARNTEADQPEEWDESASDSKANDNR